MPVRSVLILLVCAAVALVSGCDSAPAPPAAAAPPIPIARLNTSAMTVPRIDFCALVPSAAIAAALGGPRADSTAYRNGQRSNVTGDGADVVAEHGCIWTARGGAIARAWVFARPVAPAFARVVIRQARREDDCRLVRGPQFGTPALTQQCIVDGAVRVGHAGLFGSSWLSCEVQADAPRRQVRDRADAWCVTIANVLNTSR